MHSAACKLCMCRSASCMHTYAALLPTYMQHYYLPMCSITTYLCAALIPGYVQHHYLAMCRSASCMHTYAQCCIAIQSHIQSFLLYFMKSGDGSSFINANPWQEHTCTKHETLHAHARTHASRSVKQLDGAQAIQAPETSYTMSMIPIALRHLTP